MSDRIFELGREATIWCCHNLLSDDPEWESKWEQKFAELIVRKCMLCCERVISDPVPKSVDTWLNGGSQCIEEIKQHFGIE